MQHHCPIATAQLPCSGSTMHADYWHPCILTLFTLDFEPDQTQIESGNKDLRKMPGQIHIWQFQSTFRGGLNPATGGLMSSNMVSNTSVNATRWIRHGNSRWPFPVSLWMARFSVRQILFCEHLCCSDVMHKAHGLQTVHVWNVLFDSASLKYILLHVQVKVADLFYLHCHCCLKHLHVLGVNQMTFETELFIISQQSWQLARLSSCTHVRAPVQRFWCEN